MARSEVSAQELMRIVIDEVDQARDIYQLAEQLAGHLPIRSMDELVKALDGSNCDSGIPTSTSTPLRVIFPRLHFRWMTLAGSWNESHISSEWFRLRWGWIWNRRMGSGGNFVIRRCSPRISA